MIFTTPTPFAEAAEHSAVKVLLPSSLNSAEALEHLDAEIRERARFSSQITNAEILDELGRQVDELVAGKTDLVTARNILRARARELGYQPEPGKEGTIQDFTSIARLNIALLTPVQMAQGYGQYMQGQDPAVLDLYPAQELYRAQARKVPRNWATRWSDAAKRTRTMVSGFVALKNTDIWTAISRFGTPYAPYDFNSGMRSRAVARARAMALGLIDLNAQVPPQSRDFVQDLAVTPQIRDTRLRQAITESNPAVHFDAAGTLHLKPTRPAGNEADDEPTDAELARAIIDAYDPDDDTTWDIGDDERELFDHDVLEKLALKRYLEALCNVDADDVQTAGNVGAPHHSGRQKRCPRGTVHGGRFCRSLAECGGVAASNKLGPMHARARAMLEDDLKAVEHLSGAAYTQALRARLQVKKPAQIGAVITGIHGATPAETAIIQRHAQEMLNIIPPRVIKNHLKEFRVEVVNDARRNFAGQWKQGSKTLVLNRAHGGVEQSTIYHEMGHWMHDNGPKPYRAAVQNHYMRRTFGETAKASPSGFNYRRDQLYDDYTGCEYGGARRNEGTEVVSRHMEHLYDGPNRGFGVTGSQSLSELVKTASYRETAGVAYTVLYYGRKRP